MESLEIPLVCLKDFPGSLEGLQPTEVRQVFPAPTLIALEGHRKEPLFVSFLIHGNETTSFYVLQRLQKYLQTHSLPRSLLIFVSNVFATEKNVRFLPHQKDYNRVWLGGDSPEHSLIARVKKEIFKGKDLFASIDIHNNTGLNPFYACVSRLENTYVTLASLFSKTIVYFKNPETAQSFVFSEHCPSVTIECGQSGEPLGVEKAFQFVVDCLHVETLNHQIPSGDVNIYETVGRIEMKDNIAFGFGKENAPVCFPTSFDKYNFTQLEAGSHFAEVKQSLPPFKVSNNQGDDIFGQYFAFEGSSLKLKRPFVPSMFTKDKSVIAQDCLGYIMKNIG